MKRQKTLEDELYIVGIIFLICAGIGLLIINYLIIPNFNITLPKCIFGSILGIYCPGCGGTRAVFSLLQGKFLESLWYHPFVLYVVVIYSGFMITHTLKYIHFPRIKGMKFRAGYLYGALVIIVINFILKNMLKFCFGIEMI